MDPFLLDVLYGVLLIVSLSASLVGVLAYRYRREAGPLILAFSGLPGTLSSILFIIESSNAADIPGWIPIICLVVFIVLILVAVIRWRGKR